MTRKDVKRLLGVLMVEYSDFVATEPKVDLWSHIFRDDSELEVLRAVHAHVAESRFAPKASEIRDRMAATRSGCPDVDQSLAEIHRNIGRYGSRGVPIRGGGFGPIPWSHPAIAAAVAAIGWEAICTSENHDTWRAQLRDCYKSAAARAVRSENVGRLEAAAAAKIDQLAERVAGQLVGRDGKTS